MSVQPGSRGLRAEALEASTGRTASRSPTAWWLASATVAAAGTWLAAATGSGTLAWALAFWAIVSLYGSVDQDVEGSLAELGETVAPVPAGPPVAALAGRGGEALAARQRRVARFLAYGIPDDEIAELLELDPAAITSDVDQILAHLGVVDRSQAVDATAGLAPPAADRRRSAA